MKIIDILIVKSLSYPFPMNTYSLLSKLLLFLLFVTALFGTHCLAAIEHTGIIDMSFVEVGDPGNESDEFTEHGAVDHPFFIGTYDVTAAQYCVFLNAVAATDDPHKLYDEKMEQDKNIACIRRQGIPGRYTYSIIEAGYHRENFPITYVNWYSAARFCNWMQNNCPSGYKGTLATESGTYTLLCWDNQDIVLDINENATYRLPTEDEWYKAAYYDHSSKIDSRSYWNYPTQSDFCPSNNIDHYHWNSCANYKSPRYFFWGEKIFTQKDPPHLTPVGTFNDSASPYGAYDMGGNVFQWTSTRSSPDAPSLSFIIRGGSWDSLASDLSNSRSIKKNPSVSNNHIGFRLVKIIPRFR